MIDVYKIGLNNYFDSNGNLIDKNSGYFEYERIKHEVRTLFNPDVCIVINGRFESDDEEMRLIKRIRNYKIRIFVASDIVAFKSNKRVIEECTHLLHQCPNGRIEEFTNLKQSYSYVPELFWNGDMNVDEQDDLLCFGGGYRGNEERINAYLNAVPSISFIKDDDGHDNRLNYIDYKREMSKHKFNLIISREDYSKIGWITARFFETVSLGVLPIVDENYDSTNYLEALKCNPKNVKSMIDLFKNDEFRTRLLEEYERKIIAKRHMFRATIRNILEEYKNAGNC